MGRWVVWTFSRSIWQEVTFGAVYSATLDEDEAGEGSWAVEVHLLPDLGVEHVVVDHDRPDELVLPPHGLDDGLVTLGHLLAHVDEGDELCGNAEDLGGRVPRLVGLGGLPEELESIPG